MCTNKVYLLTYLLSLVL